jgi:hypothetical protein
MRIPTDTPITSRVTLILAAVERSPHTAFLFGLILALACVALGWYLRGLWGPLLDNRGWAALLVFAVIGASLAVRRESGVR